MKAKPVWTVARGTWSEFFAVPRLQLYFRKEASSCTLQWLCFYIMLIKLHPAA